MATTPKPNFYAIIPADVRYADITPNAKLLYGEITALCSREGFCWAGNPYFADLYHVNRSSIKRWMNELEGVGAIKIEGSTNKRHITLGSKIAQVIKSNLGQKRAQTRVKNGPDSNTESITVQNGASAVVLMDQKGGWESSDLKAYVDELCESKQAHIRVIGMLIKAKGFSLSQFENRKQIQGEISRLSRPASRLTAFGEERLWKVLEFLREHAKFKWGLETVEKYITEPELKPEMLPGFRSART